MVLGVLTIDEFFMQNTPEIMKLQDEHKELFGQHYAPFDWESMPVSPEEWLEEFKRTVEEGRAKRQSASERWSGNSPTPL